MLSLSTIMNDENKTNKHSGSNEPPTNFAWFNKVYAVTVSAKVWILTTISKYIPKWVYTINENNWNKSISNSSSSTNWLIVVVHSIISMFVDTSIALKATTYVISCCNCIILLFISSVIVGLWSVFVGYVDKIHCLKLKT